MESRHFGIGTVPYRLEAVLIKAGSDVVVVVAGGQNRISVLQQSLLRAPVLRAGAIRLRYR